MEKKIMGKETMDGLSYNGSAPNFAQGGIPSFDESNAKVTGTHKTSYFVTGILISLILVFASVVLYKVTLLLPIAICIATVAFSIIFIFKKDLRPLGLGLIIPYIIASGIFAYIKFFS
jgi:hypothetical protein